MTHVSTKESGQKVGGVEEDPSSGPRLHLLASSAASYLALMEYMEVMMKLGHYAAESNVAAAQVAGTVTKFAGKAAYDVYDTQANASEFQAAIQRSSMGQAIGTAVVGGASFGGQFSATRFSTKMEGFLSEAQACKNKGGATVADPSVVLDKSVKTARLGFKHDIDNKEEEALQNYTDKLKKGTLTCDEYREIIKNGGLDHKLEGRITLRHVLEYAHGTSDFDVLVKGVSEGRDNSYKELSGILAKVDTLTNISNQVVNSIAGGWNTQATLGQAQAQRDQGAASQQQTLLQGGLQLLQDAMKTQDQLFGQVYGEAQQVYTQYVQAAVSVDTRG